MKTFISVKVQSFGDGTIKFKRTPDKGESNNNFNKRRIT
jgi:hypothetical protein